MNVRGIFPSLGAGGSLTAAVLCAAALVGGGLAFRGDAGGNAEANAGDVTVPDAAVHKRTPSPRPVRTGPAVSTTAAERTRTPTATDSAPRRRTTRATVRRNATAPHATITPQATTPPAPATAPRPSTPAPVKPSRPPVPTAPTPATPSGTVTQTVRQVRQATKPVVDAVPEPARSQAQTVTDTVEQVTGVVDQTVDGLTSGLLP
jgi:hypothetical protein